LPTSNPTESTDIKLAVYAERLDRYIVTQEALNKSLVTSYNALHLDISAIREWRSKVYGVKTALLGVGFLAVHLAVIVGALTGVNWVNNK
jgi:hypothetical protein